MNTNPEIDPKLDALLQSLRHTTTRDGRIASNAREAFLSEVVQISTKAARISSPAQSRVENWKENLNNSVFGYQKTKRPLFNLFMAMLLVLVVIFGGGATTVAAAQTAQPDDILYPVKTWSEDVRLGLEIDPQVKIDLTLEFTARRADEIQQLLAAENSIPEQVVTRFENQQQETLEIAAGMPDAQAISALERIREQALQQEQRLTQLKTRSQASQQIHAHIQTMLQTQEQIARHGIQDPTWLRQRGRYQNQVSSPTAITTEVEPTLLSGGNPWVTGTPSPGNGSNPGGLHESWPTGSPNPGAGNGSGPGAGACTTCATGTQNGKPTQQPGLGSGTGGSGSGNGSGSGSGGGGGGGGGGSGGGGGGKP